MKKIKIIACSFLTFLFIGCTENPIETEQYFKQVYLVGSYEFVQTQTLPYNAIENELFISVAIGGSLPSEQDVAVTLVEEESAIDRYNDKYIPEGDIRYQKLPTEYYKIPSMNAVIKAGNVYQQIPVKVKTAGLHCDSLYCIPFKIASSSCPIVKSDTILLMSFSFTNKYAATYQMEGSKSLWKNGAVEGTPSALSTLRELKAVDENTVRLYNLADLENKANISTSCLTLKVNADNTVEVNAWDQLLLTQGGGTYDPVKKVFDIWYHYIDGINEYRIEIRLKK